ncbi:hypothetical protein BU14_0783s0004 [Porphyra umbilicalis]|uniref:Uncharacterized protein n=1 Tax=Porphyra umbilicalis TaxID=2786 RepID=A0A1X6NP36_PORUM|nr:hypothetical protein BU14_0783s0004 [Porphyra umbilicalis]|eukprot:OSX70342.1 hypothetical protein BU14_0783s0004 [Porphyra umbilicalis]
MWKAGDARTCEGGHNACYLRDGVDPELLEQYRTDGAPAGVVEDGTCTFIAPKCHKGKVCDRHGGEDPPLERAGNGSACPVRARLLHPTFIKDASNIRVILLLFNTHNHVYHVCKPSGAAILDAIETHPDASICSLQRAVASSSDGARADARHLRNLRASARAAKNPHGQDLLEVMDLRRRAEGEHLCMREIVDNDEYKIILLQSDQQAQLSGRLCNFQADTTFDVVAPGSAPPTGRPLRKRVPLVALVLDLETAEHDGAFEAMTIEFGGAPSDYYGRVIGCRVQLCRFLLKKCGNDPMDAFMRAVLAMRDSPPPGDLAAVRVELEALSARASVAGEGKKVELIKWMLNNGSALRAAFPLSAGALSRTEVLAACQSTNASESLNLQTQVEVKERGPRTLLRVIKTLMEFDALVMSEVMPTGKGFSVGGDSERVRLTRSLNLRKRNAIPAGGAPPKASP